LLDRLAERSGLSEDERAVLREAAGLFRGSRTAGSPTSRSAARRRRIRQRAAGAEQEQESVSLDSFDAVMWTDGAARGNPGPAGIGAIIKTVEGETLATCSESFGRATNNAAEYAALLMGLRRALQLGLRRLDVRADSELLVRQLRGEYRVKNAKLKPLYEEATKLLSQFEVWALRHVPREANAEADRLANEGIDTA
jgi:ribonuclease HI